MKKSLWEEYFLENRKKPMSGQIYRHFKGNLYQILTVASHTETGEELVIYQALYGNFKFYARPLSMFMSKVDRIKYPNTTAIYRFEVYNPQDVKENADEAEHKPDVGHRIYQSIQKDNQLSEITDDNSLRNERENISTILMDFLEADTFKEKLDIVRSNKNKLNDKIINDMAMSVDYTVTDGDLEERITSLIYCLETKIRFEVRRLR